MAPRRTGPRRRRGITWRAIIDQPLGDIFRGVGRTCRATRGVVMALARFEWTARKVDIRQSFGNIEARVIGQPGVRSTSWFVAALSGVHADQPGRDRASVDTQAASWFCIRTGSARAGAGRILLLSRIKSADAIARGLLRALAKEEDDATVVVVWGKMPSSRLACGM